MQSRLASVLFLSPVPLLTALISLSGRLTSLIVISASRSEEWLAVEAISLPQKAIYSVK